MWLMVIDLHIKYSDLPNEKKVTETQILKFVIEADI